MHRPCRRTAGRRAAAAQTRIAAPRPIAKKMPKRRNGKELDITLHTPGPALPRRT